MAGTEVVVIDNTNLSLHEMRPYVLEGLKNDYTIDLMEPTANSWIYDPTILAQRNTHGVSEAAIRRMLLRFAKNPTVDDILDSTTPTTNNKSNYSSPRSSAPASPVLRRAAASSQAVAATPPPAPAPAAAAAAPLLSPAAAPPPPAVVDSSALSQSPTKLNAWGQPVSLTAGSPSVPSQGKRGGVRRKSGKFLLVLDVNGLLVDRVKHGGSEYLRSRGVLPDSTVNGVMIYKRPGVDEFVDWLTRNYEVAVWSSCKRHNLDPILQSIFPRNIQQKLVCTLDQDACDVDGTVQTESGGTKQRFIKDLNRVWSQVGEGAQIDHVTTLLIDDSPYKAARNPANTAIHPHEYKASDLEDRELIPGGQSSR